MPVLTFRQRMNWENEKLHKYMPGFQLYDCSGNTVVEGWARTSGGQNCYRGRLVVSPSFPFEKPALYLISPNPLWMFGGTRTINSLGPTASFCTRDNGPEMCVQICHTDTWDATMTCVFVLQKLHLWLEAYEAHLQSGKSIDTYLHPYSY